MKLLKACLTGLVLACSFFGSAYAASEKSGTVNQRSWEFYEDSRNVKSIEVTLPTTAGVGVTTVTCPSWAKGFKIYPRTNPIRFSVRSYNTEDLSAPAAVATSASGTAITESTLAVGGIAKADMWEIRLLPSDGHSTRYLYLRSSTHNSVIDLEFYQ